MTTRPVLARDAVRYVGNPVAFVVAETPEAVRDGAELIEIEYELCRQSSISPMRWIPAPRWSGRNAARICACIGKATTAMRSRPRSPRRTKRVALKGIGEGGACGAPPAIVSAVCDAPGLAHLEMPLLPERVWEVLRQSGSALAAD